MNRTRKDKPFCNKPNDSPPDLTYKKVVDGEKRIYSPTDREWYFHAGWTWDGERGQWYRVEQQYEASTFAEQILSLLKEEGWIPPHSYDISSGVCEVCDQLNSDKMRKHGWLHKGDPTDVMVEEKCPVIKEMENTVSYKACGFNDYNGCRRIHQCNGCNFGTISRPMTVGEIQNKAKEWVEALQTARNVLVVACGETAPYIKIALQKIDNALTLNGGKIKKEG